MEHKSPPPPRNERAPRMEHWTWDEMRKRLAEAAVGDKPGVCEYEQLPDTVEFGGTFLTRFLELQQHSITHFEERGFQIVYNPDTNGLLLTVEHTTQDTKMGAGSNGAAEIQGMQIKTILELSQKASSTQDPNFFRKLYGAQEAFQRAMGMGMLPAFMSRAPEAKIIRQNYRHSIGFAHSHHIPLPFSAMDIAVVLGEPMIRFAPLIDRNGDMSLLLPTHETTMFNTQDEISATAHRWIDLIVDRGKKVMEEYGPGKKMIDHELLRMARQRAGGVFEDMSEQVDNEISYRMQEALLKTIAQKRKLGYYKGRNGKLERVV